MAGALGKIAEGGRNWEGWGPDPYLTGKSCFSTPLWQLLTSGTGIAAAVTVEAMQAVGVQATIKHYILNEQELNRETMSSSVDDRSMVNAASYSYFFFPPLISHKY